MVQVLCLLWGVKQRRVVSLFVYDIQHGKYSTVIQSVRCMVSRIKITGRYVPVIVIDLPRTHYVNHVLVDSLHNLQLSSPMPRERVFPVIPDAH